MKKRIVSFLITIVLLSNYFPAMAADSDFSDVPANHWAAEYISRATQLGLINGMGSGLFGVGQNVTRAQFAALLVRLFGWEPVMPEEPSFTDNDDTSEWYYSVIETAVANGAVLKDGETFRPDDDITREDMAVMLVRALGYDLLASSAADYGLPFMDVTRNIGYITLAYDFGMINGMTGTAFEPNGYATREQAATIIIRMYDKYSAQIDWLHAFYAIASYSQADSIPDMDALSFGWSKLEYTTAGGVCLNTTTAGGNEFYIPSGYSSVVKIVQDSAVPANLNIYMSTSQTVMTSDGTTSDPCREILLDPENRAAATAQITSQLQTYPFLSGVTIDFEGMSGDDLKAGLTAFLKELRASMDDLGKTIYVCVPPVVSDGQYFDAYDYRAIGEYSDKVILMAHDYQATYMPANLMDAGFTTTPLTPINEVYYALKAITDPDTGVQDADKIALAISFNTEQWQLQDGKVINATPYHPDTESVYGRLADSDTTMNYSKRYENPYLAFYNSADDTQNVLWYEDERSIAAKISLAHMFGVNGVSIWRLGLIPDYADGSGRDIYFDALDMLVHGK
ncbi:MAG: S-layer homology domain-containing protein [Oscillospiraceae bacterium]